MTPLEGRARLHPFLRVLFLVLLLVSSAGAQPGRSVVIWLSLDGMRGDYADIYAAPTLQAMMKEGVYSRHMVDTFPPLTFPSHTALATGVPAGVHGITGSNFYDRKTGLQYNMPTESQLVQAEPIWVTAARQSVRSIVLDWPLSYHQQGPFRAVVSSPGFESHWSDAERFDRLLEAWEQDRDPNPIRLLMGYCPSVDSIGHHDGPESARLGQTVLAVDEQIKRLRQRAIEVFKQKMRPDDRLFFVISADHGMAKTHTLVHPTKLLGELPAQIKVVENSTSLLLYLGEDARPLWTERISQRLRGKQGVRMVLSSQFPPQWGYAHPDRSPDLLILARPGWSFSKAIDSLYGPSAGKGVLGNHGYAPEECPEMDALLVIWQYGTTLGGRDLGTVSQLAVYPTICQILGIKPAPGPNTPGLGTSVP